MGLTTWMLADKGNTSEKGIAKGKLLKTMMEMIAQIIEQLEFKKC